MAKQANRMMIGGFVVVAVFLLMASLVVFGSGRFFKRTETFVLYFEGSIKGLNVGAPVLFQGVQIGSVSNIVIRAYRDELKTRIPVTIEIEPERFEAGDQRTVAKKPGENLPKLIEMGLRGVLTQQSFITGQLMIEFDFYPDTPVVYRDTDKQYLEIPTIKSTTERLAQSLQQFDVDGLQKGLQSVLAGIDQLVNDPNLHTGLDSLRATLEEMRILVAKLDARLDPLADRLDTTLADAGTLVNNVNRKVDPLAERADTTFRAYTKLAKETDAKLAKMLSGLDATMVAARDVISQDAPLMVELKRTLEEVADAARSFRLLADYLEQHPETLIQGKENTGR